MIRFFLEASSSITQVSSTNKHVPNLYKIVGDNLDKNIKARFMRTNYKVKSLHYFHYYAVPDRIHVSERQKDRLPSCIPSPDSVAKSLLLTLCDDMHALFSSTI